MDTLRSEDREINHHGVKREVGEDKSAKEGLPSVEIVSPSDLRHRREDKEVEARKKYYDGIKNSLKKKERLAKCKKIGRVYIPIFIITFVCIFWGYGLSQI